MHMHMHRLFLVLEYLNLKRSRTPFRRAPELRPSQGSSCAVTREAAREAGAAQEAQLAPTAQPQPPSAQAGVECAQERLCLLVSRLPPTPGWAEGRGEGVGRGSG